MGWFTASVILGGLGNSGEPVDVYEECIYLVRAPSELEAKARAEQLARNDKESSYESVVGNAVRWRFLEVVDVCELLNDPIEGAEVFGRFLTKAAYEALVARFQDQS